MNKRKLQIEHLESKLKQFPSSREVGSPPTGWIKAIRLALGMSLRQLSEKMGTSKQNAQELEERESEGTIT